MLSIGEWSVGGCVKEDPFLTAAVAVLPSPPATSPVFCTSKAGFEIYNSKPSNLLDVQLTACLPSERRRVAIF